MVWIRYHYLNCWFRYGLRTEPLKRMDLLSLEKLSEQKEYCDKYSSSATWRVWLTTLPRQGRCAPFQTSCCDAKGQIFRKRSCDKHASWHKEKGLHVMYPDPSFKREWPSWTTGKMKTNFPSLSFFFFDESPRIQEKSGQMWQPGVSSCRFLLYPSFDLPWWTEACHNFHGKQLKLLIAIAQ